MQAKQFVRFNNIRILVEDKACKIYILAPIAMAAFRSLAVIVRVVFDPDIVI